MPLQPRVTEVEKLLFCSDLVAIGAFRCPSTHRIYRDSEPMSGYTLVFPRSSTTILYQGAATVTAGPPTILFYNRGQAYSRRKIDAIDSCDWYMVAPDVLREIVIRYDPAAADRGKRIFNFQLAPATEAAYLAQRRLHSALSAGSAVDALEVEESVLALAEGAVREATSRPTAVRAGAEPAIEHVKAVIAADPTSNPTLRSLAASAGCSPFQLCRAFRKATGSTITAYRHALRLRIALEALDMAPSDVTAIALDLGYSSHSHFTKNFRQRFGMTPSEFRRRASAESIAPRRRE